MRKGYLLTLLICAAPPAAAQGFEGVITMTVLGNTVQEMHWTIKGERSAASFTLQTFQGNLAIRYFLDNTQKTNTMLLPFANLGGPGSNGVALTSSLDTYGGEGDKRVIAAPRKLGTSQQIAGIPCDDYELGDVARTQACLASGLGLFAYPTTAKGLSPTGEGSGAKLLIPKLLTGDQVAAMAPPGEKTLKGMSDASDVSYTVKRSQTNDRGVTVTTFVNAPVDKGTKGVAEASRTQTVVINIPGEAGPTKVTVVDGQVTAINGKEPSNEALQALRGLGVAFDGLTGLAPQEQSATLPQWVEAIGTVGFPLRVWSKSGATHLQVTSATPGAVPDAAFVIPPGYPAPRIGGTLPSPR